MSYRHPEPLLITSRQWRQGKKRYYAHLNLPADPERYVDRYKQRLDEGGSRTNGTHAAQPWDANLMHQGKPAL